METLLDFVEREAYELKKDFFKVENRMSSKSRWDRIFKRHDGRLETGLASINTSLRLLNWFNDYLSGLFSYYKPYMFEYLDYKKALGRKGLEYVSNFQNKTNEEIKNFIVYLVYRGGDQYPIPSIINDKSRETAEIVEKLLFMISRRPGKVSLCYDIESMFEWLNNNIDWLTVDPTEYKNPKYISYLIGRLDSYMVESFASAGKRYKNGLNAGKKI